MTANYRPDDPSTPPDRVVKSVDDVRQGVETGHVRWILRFSVALAIIAMVGAYAWFAMQPHNGTPQNVQAEAGQATGQSAGGGETTPPKT